MKNRAWPYLVTFALLVVGPAAHAQDDSAVKDFEQRVNNYESLKSQQNVSTKQTASPEKLAQQKEQAAAKTETARPAAHQGNIFGPAISAYFRKQIAATMRGAEGKKIRTSMRHAEPLPNLHLQVNAPYPKDLPLQSTPPSLLLNLPQLPKDLQYRVVGSTLVLYDETSNLIVDLLPNAIAKVGKPQ